MANSTRSAGSSRSEPGLRRLAVLPLEFDGAQGLDLAVFTDELLGGHGKLAAAASWDEEVRSLIGQ
jgi:hypothetical protein